MKRFCWRKYFSCLVIDVWKNLVSHIYMISSAENSLSLATFLASCFLSFFSFFLLCLLLSFPFSFSFSVSLTLTLHLCFNYATSLVAFAATLLDDYFLLTEKKDHASDHMEENSRARESTIWSLCFCLLRGGLPTRHWTSKRRQKTSFHSKYIHW